MVFRFSVFGFQLVWPIQERRMLAAASGSSFTSSESSSRSEGPPALKRCRRRAATVSIDSFSLGRSLGGNARVHGRYFLTARNAANHRPQHHQAHQPQADQAERAPVVGKPIDDFLATAGQGNVGRLDALETGDSDQLRQVGDVLCRRQRAATCFCIFKVSSVRICSRAAWSGGLASWPAATGLRSPNFLEVVVGNSHCHFDLLRRQADAFLDDLLGAGNVGFLFLRTFFFIVRAF